MNYLILAAAAAGANSSTEEPNALLAAIFSFIPILIFLVVIGYFLRRSQKTFGGKADAQTEQLTRIEKQLDRIASALERQNPKQ